ncbi:MAG: hypothetical protein QXM04_02830 [Nanopusillaceae archaeon]
MLIKKVLLNLRLVLVLLIIPFTVVYSQNELYCNINVQNSCLIGLYSIERNSHASFCNQLGYLNYGCEIRNNQYRIPINFSSEDCEGSRSIYLYNSINSHVGFSLRYYSTNYPGTYPFCLDNRFRKVLDITTEPSEDTYFLLGLYNLNGSHVSLSQNEPVKLYIKILDKINPDIILENLENYIELPSTIRIEFRDDIYLYFCQLYINNIPYYDFSPFCRFNSYYENNITLSSKECPSEICNVKIIALDLAGNLNVLEHTYRIVNPCLNIYVSPLSWDSILITDFLPYDLRIKIYNPSSCYGNFVNITVTFPESECQNIILVDGLQKRSFNISRLNNGEFYEIKTKIYPLKLGRCNFIINVEGYLEGKNKKYVYTKQIPLSIATRTPIGTLIISEPFYSLIIVILLISLILFL